MTTALLFLPRGAAGQEADMDGRTEDGVAVSGLEGICIPSGPPEKPPEASDETGGYGPYEVNTVSAEGGFSPLSIGGIAEVESIVPCYAGTSQCSNGRFLNVARVNAGFNSDGSAWALVEPYFRKNDDAYCGRGGEQGAGVQVGPLYRNNGAGFLDVYLGNSWVFDASASSGGRTGASLTVFEYWGPGCITGASTGRSFTDSSTCILYRSEKNWQEPRGSKTWSQCGESGSREVCGCDLPDVRITAPAGYGTYSYRYNISVEVRDFSGNLLASDGAGAQGPKDTCFQVDWTNNPSSPTGNTLFASDSNVRLPLWAGRDQCTGDVRIPLGLAQLVWLSQGPDLCNPDMRTVATLQGGEFVGSVPLAQPVILYLPLTITHDLSANIFCTDISGVRLSVREYTSSDCSGRPVRQWDDADTIYRVVTGGLSDEARADRGSYCDGQYGDANVTWHLPDWWLPAPSSYGYRSYGYDIAAAPLGDVPWGPSGPSQVASGCFRLYWAPGGM